MSGIDFTEWRERFVSHAKHIQKIEGVASDYDGVINLAWQYYQEATTALHILETVHAEREKYIKAEIKRQAAELVDSHIKMDNEIESNKILCEINAQQAAELEVLRGTLAKCRHQACFSVGESEALANQLSIIRDIIDGSGN